MTTYERMLSIRLMEKIRKQPEYAHTIGIEVKTDNNKKKTEAGDNNENKQ